MEWLIVAVIGAVLGMLVSLLAREFRMPQIVPIILGMMGALGGGALYKITGVPLFGALSFYMSGVILAIGVLAGGLLAFNLTRSETRV